MKIHALTSIGPSRALVQQVCLESWRAIGLDVHIFLHPSEAHLADAYHAADVVPVEHTAEPVFGKHYIPIKRMLDWAREREADVLLLNSDIELETDLARLQQLRAMAPNGLCCLQRLDHTGRRDDEREGSTRRYTYGFDGFLFNGRDADLFEESFLCMGKPWWDYWPPYAFLAAGRPVYRVEDKLAYHLQHRQAWNWGEWETCRSEFARLIKDDQPITTLAERSIQHINRRLAAASSVEILTRASNG